MSADATARAHIVVRGIVQGVGFRPFIHRLAHQHNLAGWVLNSTEGVIIEVEGSQASIAAFIRDIPLQAPPMSVIERVESSPLPPVGYKDFVIEKSQEHEGEFVLISSDISICPDCLREVFDPKDRHYRYPFTNCTNCGPRFTIIQDIPYDRPRTTMKAFKMCPACQREYDDPADRRFHAQPNACPVCGPQVWLVVGGDVVARRDDAIRAARRLLAQGKVVAIKGIGGFHLACDATSDAAGTLRQRKHRVDKPFAIMLRSIEDVERYCYLDQGERQLLGSSKRPIVLLRRRPGSPISEHVAPRNQFLGVMLPYTPLHYLLLESDADYAPLALVMTSGNMSEEPIAIDNAEALRRLAGLADAFLLHDRDIHLRCDDSVTRVFDGREAIMRRSRGYAPFPVRLSFEAKQILAVGAELKNTFCLTRQNYAFLSQHIGDLENMETLASFEQGIEHMKHVFKVEPEVIAHDMHPEYLSTRYALKLKEVNPSLKLVPVQHHHAHTASVMAESGLSGPVIGVSFDGTGYGLDGAIWGGEFLVADYRDFTRYAHLEYVPLPGGDAAIRRPYRTALSYLLHFGHDPSILDVDTAEKAIIARQIERGLNSPLTSSCGRLFDAISAILGVRQVVNYEGQAAIEMEMLADESVLDAYHFDIRGQAPSFDKLRTGPFVVSPAPLLEAVLKDKRDGLPVPAIAARFHNAVAKMVVEVCALIRQREGISVVCLSGGVFQNTFLLRRVLPRLRDAGFQPHIHHQVPTNDGGIALGQALVANARA